MRGGASVEIASPFPCCCWDAFGHVVIHCDGGHGLTGDLKLQSHPVDTDRASRRNLTNTHRLPGRTNAPDRARESRSRNQCYLRLAPMSSDNTFACEHTKSEFFSIFRRACHVGVLLNPELAGILRPRAGGANASDRERAT